MHLARFKRMLMLYAFPNYARGRLGKLGKAIQVFSIRPFRCLEKQALIGIVMHSEILALCESMP